jgi:predicted permease
MASALVRAFVLRVRDIGAPYWIDWSMDPTAFAYVAAISLGSGLLFGLAPALQLSAMDPVRGLKESGRWAGAGERSRSLIGALVVVEISLTLVLMAGAGLFVRSLMTLGGVDIGFRTGGLITATVPLDEQRYPRPEDRAAFVETLTASLGTERDVAGFTFASKVPGTGSDRRSVTLADRDLADRLGAYPRVAAVSIAPGYFAALGLTMARGREFSWTDGGGAPNAVIVNQRFASRYWPGEDPLGKRLRWIPPSGRAIPGDDVWSTVVGVSPAIRQTTLHRDVEPLVYEPPRQGWPFWFVVMARARSTPDAAVRALREAAHAADPNLALLNTRPYGEILDLMTVQTRLLSAMFSMFAAIGIALSAFGVSAVTTYAASRRRQEIGVRVALGARRRDVVWLILRGGLAQLAIALPIGLAGAAAAGRALQGALFDISPLDAATFVSIPLLLAAVVVLASLVPAWRAAQLNPLDAIRE